MKDSYGGFLPLEMSKGVKNKYSNMISFQSSRAALRYFIDDLLINKVWLPVYTCDALLSVFFNKSIEINYYHLNDDFSISTNIELDEHEYIIYVNYFGLNDKNVRSLLKKHPYDQVIIDNSQAFFSKSYGEIATVYSARKFFGVPDGGFLQTLRKISRTINDSLLKADNYQHLLLRLQGDDDIAYQHFLTAEKCFEDTTPRKATKLTELILGNLDYDDISSIRLRNFEYLHEKLKSYNQLKLEVENAPLCYPLLTRKKISKAELIAKKIFVPTYWKDCLNRKLNVFESSMVEDCIFLPIDQRYDINDMEHISKCIVDMFLKD